MMATLMAADAQRIMTVSLKKIVESRTRRGGVCLHRNLLIAGVLFKARDVLLAESASRSNAESCPSRTTTTVAAADDDQSVPVAEEPQSMDEGDSEVGVQSSSSMSSASTFVDTVESSSVEAPSPMMAADDGQSEGKENVPPKEVVVVAAAAPSACDVKPRAATKRSHSTIVDDVVPAKAARLESELPAAQDRSTTKTVEHAEPEVHCAAAPVSCTSSSSLSSDCHASRYHSQSAVKRPDSSSRTTSVHLPVVCLPRVDVKSSCYGMKVRDTMSRPILVMQVV